MHLLAAQPGRIADGEGAVDLAQTPGQVLFLSAADTDLSCMAAAYDKACHPTLRLANLLRLTHPMSVDLYLDRMIGSAKIVLVRLLGGQTYWPYGVERLQIACAETGVKLAFLPGDGKWDPSLAALGNIAPVHQRRLSDYFAAGGIANARTALDFLRGLLLDADAAPAALPPEHLPQAGLYEVDPVSPATPSAYVIFYRALVQSGDTQIIDDLIAALRLRGLRVRALFVPSLRDAGTIAAIRTYFQEDPPDIILNGTGFAAGSWDGSQDGQAVLGEGDCPILQFILSGNTQEYWSENSQGLNPRDVAMHVALPEVDGRILSRAVAFKSEARYDPDTECAIMTLQSQPSRVDYVADLAWRWVTLRRKSTADRRVAIILAQYPHRLSRLANGVGLDTPQSVIQLLSAMRQAGYQVTDMPLDGADLMQRVTRMAQDRPVRWDVKDYVTWYGGLPQAARARIEAKWGPPDKDPHIQDGAFSLAVTSIGHVVIGVQPARGYGIDPVATYHDPDLPPPHAYLAFYGWLRQCWGMDAAIHFGKHGNLEWLPGKALALSDSCFPEIALGPMPHLYPFIVNDPGEGSQAKRRAAAVIVDHLTPPLTRAETYGRLRALENLVDEYYEAATLDPRRCQTLRQLILETIRRENLHHDLGVDDQTPIDETLLLLDAHLCALKELQIRDGLHVFGVAPEGRFLTDLLAALTRLPRGTGEGTNASLPHALARDLHLTGDGFDPLKADFAKPWTGLRPEKIPESASWRHHGDVVESLEILAASLIEGRVAANKEWQNTGRVLDWIAHDLQPRVLQSAEDEIKGLLKGLSGRFVPPGPSGAPTRGKPDVLPTGRNFFSVDPRAVPTSAAWALGWKSATLLMERFRQDHGEWPRQLALSAWGTANMRTGGDDIAQALALMGVRPRWDEGGGRVAGFEILPLSLLDRPRVDVTFRISGFFRDAFPFQIDLLDSAVRAVAALDEPDDLNPLAARYRADLALAQSAGNESKNAAHWAGSRIFGAKPGAYGAGMQALIDEGGWSGRGDFAAAYLAWGGFVYGGGQNGEAAGDLLTDRLRRVQAVVHNQDNREHDLLDSDDYYQFEGGLAAAIATLSGREPTVYHNDHSRPESPRIQTLEEELAKIVRGRAVNPKWIAGAMRHGYKGAFEMAATVDYLFAFAATTHRVASHHFDALFDAYLNDPAVHDFLAEANPHALHDIAARLLEARDRGLWRPGRNDMADRILTTMHQFGKPAS